MSHEIAIIGMGCRFPGAKTIQAFWENLIQGQETIRFFSDQELIKEGILPDLLDNPDYVKAKGSLDDVPYFDAAFFGISPRDAETMDPQHRFFLTCCWEALENAGYCTEEKVGRISIFAGTSGFNLNSYYLQNLLNNQDIETSVSPFQLNLNNGSDFLSTRAAYKFNFTGPSYTIQAGCSTSLIAVSEGCQSLINYQSDMVLAGAATIDMPVQSGYLYREGMILSPDGHCRAFDEQAEGTVPGNGVGVVVLRRLEDAIADEDHIYAVIKGFALNNDGANKIGYTAPSAEGQASVIAEAQAMADVDPQTVTYIETHGTGTKQGDPIELQGLMDGFDLKDIANPYCALGSVKTNIGHLDAAAGVAGLIKVALSLYYETLPATLHFESLNHQIDLTSSPFYIQNKLSRWERQVDVPRRAGVSSFGIGGTNAHVVLEEAPDVPTKTIENNADWQVIPLSAKTESALACQKSQLLAYLKNAPDTNLDDVAYTHQFGRIAFEHRGVLVARNITEICDESAFYLQAADVLPSILGESYLATIQAWLMGEAVDFEQSLCHAKSGRHMPLPTYPFDMTRHWVDSNGLRAVPDLTHNTDESKALNLETLLLQAWKKYLGLAHVTLNDDFFELGGDSLSANQVMLSLKNQFKLECSNQALFHYPKAVDLLRHLESLQSCASQNMSSPVSSPLSSAQLRFWFLEQYEPGIYHVPHALRLDGALNYSALEKSINLLCLRHEALRLGFKLDLKGVPKQFVRDHIAFKLDVINIEEAHLKVRLREAAHQLFDLYTDTLARFILFKIDEKNHVLLINQHHIITDGWSIRLLLSELSVAYKAYLNDKTPAFKTIDYQYTQYCQAQVDVLQTASSEKYLTYWKKQLADLTPLNLPTTYTRPLIEKHDGDNVYFSFDEHLTQKLRALSQRMGTTLFTVLLSGLAVLLHRYARQDNFSIGIPVNGRQTENLTKLCGFFVNTLVVRHEIKESDNFLALLKQTKHTCLAAYEHQEVPFEQLLEALDQSRDVSRHPLFQVMFIFQNLEDYHALNLEAINTSVIPNEYHVAQMDLTFHLSETPRAINARIEYNTQLFSGRYIKQMTEHLKCLLDAIVLDPNQKIATYDLLMKEERKQLLFDWNDATVSTHHKTTLPQLFEANVLKTPDAIAVVFEQESWTYEILNQKANQLAHTLLPHIGHIERPLVGICVERNLNMLVGLLGILKAGAAYVPLDLSLPDERCRIILEEAGITVLVSDNAVIAQRPVLHNQVERMINLDVLSHASKENLTLPHFTKDSLAYVLFTSGSTGRPKGVMVRHRNVLNILLDVISRLEMGAQDRFVALSSYAFDISALELFSPLLAGATLEIAPHAMTKDPEQLATLLRRYPDSFIQATPTTFRMLTEVLSNTTLGIKVLVGGEALTEDLAKRLLAISKQVWNVYGPTETTIWSTYNPIQKASDFSNIGKGFANTTCYILDNALNPMPEGVPGDLYIGGEGLAVGYLNQPDLTKSVFIPHPFSSSDALIYKTGDIARWCEHGTLEYIGRADSQVKVRGHRVELKEVEFSLNKVSYIKQAVCLFSKINGESQLLAYYVANPEQQAHSLPELVLAGHIRDELLGYVLDYMVPTYFVRLDKFPLTVSGKINYKALPAPATQQNIAFETAVLPETAIEKIIAEIWCDVLKCQVVDVDSSFFVLGGNSILMTQVHARLSRHGYEINLVDHFQYPSVRALARFLSGESDSKTPLMLSSQASQASAPNSDDIAVVGMAGRFPGADNLSDYWSNLCEEKESISRFSDEEMREDGVKDEVFNNKKYVNASGVLEHARSFDAAFFNYSANEAKILNPQHRIFLECAWEALEDAAYAPSSYSGSIGVFAGSSSDAYLYEHLLQDESITEKFSDFELMISNSKDQLSTRVSHALGLTGPSVNVQTACSTSLVAVHLACQSLLNNECTMAIAGAEAIQARQKTGYLYREGMILSPDGHCRAFDAEAKGTVGGNGVGAVVLKRYEDAVADGDRIDAIIKGTAINNDGNLKVGFTAPSIPRQKEVITEALEKAGLSAEYIQYIETHGTGTLLGDPIEISALTQAFRQNTLNNHFCAIGSVKPNIGHLDAAAGIAGLIKTILSLKHQRLPASLHFKTQNPNINFSKTPFFVNKKTGAWPNKALKKRAGVSSFGIGGTNAHLILEEAPEITSQSEGFSEAKDILFCLSAKSATALDEKLVQLDAYLKMHPQVSPRDVMYTLWVGREKFKYRQAVVLQSGGFDLNRNAVLSSSTHKVAFLFSGQGEQHVNMGRTLYETSFVYRDWIDRGALEIQAAIDIDILQVLYVHPSTGAIASAEQELKQTLYTQPALFITEYALAKHWLALGVQPDIMIGHSLGEYVAACLAGVFSFSDAIRLVCARATLMQALPSGKMLAVFASYQTIQLILPASISIAAINADDLCVISGVSNEIDALQRRLLQDSISSKLLDTSHAFHSVMMEPMLQDFETVLRDITLHVPKKAFISNLTGQKITDEEAIDVMYWIKHLRETVDFNQGIREVGRYADVLLEIGPGQTLTRLTMRTLTKKDCLSIPSFPSIIDAVAQLWMHGVPVDVSALFDKKVAYRRVALPTYPFEKKSYFVYSKAQKQTQTTASNTQPPAKPSTNNVAVNHLSSVQDVEALLMTAWKDVLGSVPKDTLCHFSDLGGHSLLAVQLVSRMADIFNVQLPVSWVLTHPSIKAQTAYFKTHHLHYNPIVQFNQNAGGMPLVLIHPGHAGAEVYADLADLLLPEYQLFAVESYHLYHTDAPLQSIEALAEHYLHEIKKILPKGPYYLGGWSFGGTVAYEIAQHMLACGDEVSHVWLLDSFVFDEKTCADEAALDVLLYPLENEPTFQQLPLNYQKKLSQVYTLELEMLKAYRAKPYAGEITLFNANQLPANHRVLSLEETTLLHQLKYKNNYWSTHLKQFQEVLLETNHYDMMKAPHIMSVVQHLKQVISAEVLHH